MGNILRTVYQNLKGGGYDALVFGKRNKNMGARQKLVRATHLKGTFSRT